MLKGDKKGLKRNASAETCSILTSAVPKVRSVGQVRQVRARIKQLEVPPEIIKQQGQRRKLKKDRDLILEFINQIGRELVINFGKTASQAEVLVARAYLRDYLSKHPIALHDSPNEWAIKLLTKNNDIETLERYYSS